MPHSQSIRVVSYNLLSSHLAQPTHHTKCDPEHLDANNRFPKILAKLQEQIDDHSSIEDNKEAVPVVFCLQEVSHDWAKQLHIFFAQRGYHFITALYGKKFNGYMGIGTAYPIQYFDTLDVDLCRLSDKRQGSWPRPPRDIEPTLLSKVISIPKIILNSFIKTAQYVGLKSSHKPAEDPWQKAEYRYNEFIAVKLLRKASGNISTAPIWIGNYHMPCAFREPAVMTLHCDLVAQRIQSLATSSLQENARNENYNDSTSSTSSNDNNVAFILAGDFNVMPDSPQYNLLTTGILDKEESEENELSYPPIKFGYQWESSICKMKSAYALYNGGKESDFTNFAHNGALSNESFIGTLDYIFLSDKHHWKVKDVQKLKQHRNDVHDGPFPNAIEPSDHVLIAATLEV